MINDKKIKSIMQTVFFKTQNYLNTVGKMNENTLTDRLLESIFADIKRAEIIHNKRFKNLELKKNER